MFAAHANKTIKLQKGPARQTTAAIAIRGYGYLVKEAAPSFVTFRCLSPPSLSLRFRIRRWQLPPAVRARVAQLQPFKQASLSGTGTSETSHYDRPKAQERGAGGVLIAVVAAPENSVKKQYKVRRFIRCSGTSSGKLYDCGGVGIVTLTNSCQLSICDCCSERPCITSWYR